MVFDGFLSCFNGFFVWSGRWYTRFGRGGREKQKQNKQQLYASLRHIDAVRSRTKAERVKSFSTAALSKQKWNGPVAILSSALLLWDLSIWRGCSGVGGGQGGRSLLVCDTYGFWCDRVFMVLFADHHQKRSCLSRASTCFWTHWTQQVTQSAQFQPVLGTGDFIFHRY